MPDNENEKKYEYPKLRVSISSEIASIIWDYLSKNGFTLRGLQEELGFTFKNILAPFPTLSTENYNKLNNLMKEHFGVNELIRLFRTDNIPHKVTVGSSGKEPYEFENKEDLSELIGIMLGDGSLLTNGMMFNITLNSEDDPNYVNYVITFLEHLFPNSNISKVKSDGKAIRLDIFDVSIHYALVLNELVPGDKVINQVTIPQWIFSDKSFLIRCLKGLTDTDGSIYVRGGRAKSLSISFSSGSKPLVLSFQKACNDLEINTAKGITISKYKFQSKICNIYQVVINEKKEVKKFIEIIDPEKFKESLRITYLGIKLLIKNSPIEIRDAIKKEIFLRYPKKSNRRYSKLYTLFLKNTTENKYKEFLKNPDFSLPEGLIEYEITSSLNEESIKQYIIMDLKMVRKFPRMLRKNICKIIYKTILYNINSKTAIFESIVNELETSSNNELLEIFKLLHHPAYFVPLKNYLNVLIDVVKEIIYQFKREEFHPYTIAKKLNTPFDYRIIKRIVEDLLS